MKKIGYYPHMILTLPFVLALSIALSNDSSDLDYANDKSSFPPFPSLASEASAPWFTNVQNTQNVLGA